jgi:hypothetical protein
VLLKSAPTSPLGFTTKLGGFSLASILDESGRAVSLSAGAAQQQDVSLVRGGRRSGRQASPSDDVYAFGSLIWETFTRAPAAARGAAAAAAEPADAVPGPYAGLAAACWAADPAARPSMDELAESLEQLAAADLELRGFD